MPYRQIRQPDLNIVGSLYLCLKYARQVFGVASKYNSATEAWNGAAHKHSDALPTDVAVPVWFSWTGTVDGVRKNWGHVAVHVPGKGVYSSPLRSGNTKLITGTVQQMATAIGGGGLYLGWSEDINGVRVAEPVTPSGGGIVMNPESGTELYRTALFREPESGTVAAQWNGQSPAQALRAVRGPEWQTLKARLDAYPGLQSTVNDLQIALSQEQNKPPKEVVKEVEKLVDNPEHLTKISELSEDIEELNKEINQVRQEKVRVVEPSYYSAWDLFKALLNKTSVRKFIERIKQWKK